MMNKLLNSLAFIDAGHRRALLVGKSMDVCLCGDYFRKRRAALNLITLTARRPRMREFEFGGGQSHLEGERSDSFKRTEESLPQ